MVTWQDLRDVGDNERDRMSFVRATISAYQAGEHYRMAKVADEYVRRKNPDIMSYTKMLYTVTGRRVVDTYSANYKLGRGFFPYFITQEVQYLLSNGTTWGNQSTADKLGTQEDEFDTRLQEVAHAALWGGCAYGFWNKDHIDVFNSLEFVPLVDEENGALRAGIRYWQIDPSKPFRATLYEEDGYTNYIWTSEAEAGKSVERGRVYDEKRAYIRTITYTAIDPERIYQGSNYPAFPIVPMWGNKMHQSELVGLREQIFAYDMIRSGFADSVEDASYVYWAIHNAPDMSEEDLAKFVQTIKRLHVGVVEDAGASAEPHVLESPYQSREQLLDRLEKDIIKDAMAFDPDRIAGGAVTATQIKAAYENLEMKCNDFEFCVIEFINGILRLANIDDNPTFTRSKNINTSEEVQTIMQAASVLDDEYVTKKVLTILGDGDQAAEIIARKQDDEVTRQRELDAMLEKAMESEPVGNPEQLGEGEVNGGSGGTGN